jgi:hypothetical protein
MRCPRIAPTIAALPVAATACAAPVPGSALPLPGRGPVKPAGPDPCSLLTPAQAARQAWGSPGSRRATPKRSVPSGCSYAAVDDAAGYDTTRVLISDEVAVEEFFSSQPGGQADAGGRTWQVYASPFDPDACYYAVKLGPTAFAAIAGGNRDKAKSCDLVRAVAPLVAERLPR